MKEHFSPRLEELRKIQQYIANEALKLSFSPEQIQKIELLIEEIVVNIISYAELKPDEYIVIDLSKSTPSSLHIIVSDPGKAFNPLTYNTMGPLQNEESARIGGFGIYLVRSLADDLAYERKNGRNSLMIKVVKK